jgi:hypothetical protein
MGILVPEAALPMGITLSNVYMSFSNETIFIMPKSNEGYYTIQSYYKVYKNETKDPDTNIRIPFFVQVSDISNGTFQILYERLKELYPGSQDC